MTEGNGRATVAQVYAIVQRVEDKIDAQNVRVETRLDRLETWRAYLTGALAVLATGFSTALVFVRF